MNQQSLTRDRRILQFLADRVQEDQSFKQMLFTLVEYSKQTDQVEIAAANAITVLNAAKINLSGYDFQGIRIPGADLSGAWLDSVNCQSADLSNVDFQGAWLRGAHFEGAELAGVSFGEYLELELKLTEGVDDYLVIVPFICCSPDGQWLAMSQGNNIDIYDLNMHYQMTLKAEPGITCIHYSLDSEYIVTGHVDGTLNVCDSVAGVCLQTMEAHADRITSVAYSPDGKQVVSGSLDKTLKVWDVTSGKCLQTMSEHSSAVTSVAYSPDGKQVVSGSEDKTLKVWDVASGKCLQTMDGHTNGVTSVAYSPDGKQVVSGSEDKTLKVWDVIKGTGTTVGRHPGPVKKVMYSPEGKYIVSVDDNANSFSGHVSNKDYVSRLRLWSVGNIECLHAVSGGHKNKMMNMSYSPDGKYLISADQDAVIKIWDMANGVCLRTDSNGGYSVASSFDGKHFIVGCLTGSIFLKNIIGDTKREWHGSGGSQIFSLVYSFDGKCIASTGREEASIRIWDAERSDECLKVLLGHTDEVYCLAYSSDSQRIVSGSRDYTLRVWDVISGKCLRTMKHNAKAITEFQGSVTSVAYSPSGQHVVSGGSDATIKIWHVITGKCLKVLEEHTNDVRSVIYSPEGKQIISGSLDGTVKFWDIERGECVHTLHLSQSVCSMALFVQSSEEYLLAVGLEHNLVCFAVDKNLKFSLRWLTGEENALVLNDADFKDVKGLDIAKKVFLGQQGGVMTEELFSPNIITPAIWEINRCQQKTLEENLDALLEDVEAFGEWEDSKEDGQQREENLDELATKMIDDDLETLSEHNYSNLTTFTKFPAVFTVVSNVKPKYQEAQSLFISETKKALVAKCKVDNLFLYGCSLAKFDLGDYLGTIDDCTGIIQRGDTLDILLKAYSLRADAFRYVGDYSEALVDYDWLVEQDPTPEHYSMRAITKFFLGDPPNALEDSEKALSFASHKDDILVIRGRHAIILAACKRATQAIQQLINMELRPGDLGYIKYCEGMVYFLLGRYAQAVHYFDEACNLLLGQQQRKLAVTEDEDPPLDLSYLSGSHGFLSIQYAWRGWSYYKLGDKKAALTDLRHALKRIPGHKEWLEWYHQILSKTKRVDKKPFLTKNELDFRLKMLAETSSEPSLESASQLIQAVEEEQSKLGFPLKMLAKTSLEPNLELISELVQAVEEGESELVEGLLKQSISADLRVGETSLLHLAVERGHLKIIKLLAKYGADFKATDHTNATPLYLGLKLYPENEEFIRLLIEQEEKAEGKYNSTLHKVVSEGDAKVVALLISKYHMDPKVKDEDGKTALHLAVYEGHIAVTKILLEHSIPSALNEADDELGNTLLHWAVIGCEYFSTDLTERLKRLSGEPSQREHLEIVKILLERGAKRAIQNKAGKTPSQLTAAIASALHLDMFELLVEGDRLTEILQHYEERIAACGSSVVTSAEHLGLASYLHAKAIQAAQKGDDQKGIEQLVQRAEQQFKAELEQKKLNKVRIFTAFANFLIQQQRVKEALFYLRGVVELEESDQTLSYDEGSDQTLSYDLVRIDTVEPALQEQIRIHDRVEVNAMSFAFRLLIRCYLQLGQEKQAEELLSAFVEAVNVAIRVNEYTISNGRFFKANGEVAATSARIANKMSYLMLSWSCHELGELTLAEKYSQLAISVTQASQPETPSVVNEMLQSENNNNAQLPILQMADNLVLISKPAMEKSLTSLLLSKPFFAEIKAEQTPEKLIPNIPILSNSQHSFIVNLGAKEPSVSEPPMSLEPLSVSVVAEEDIEQEERKEHGSKNRCRCTLL